MSFHKAEQLLRLAMMATRRRGVSLVEIVDEFGCSHRTAQRMTVALEATIPQTIASVDDDRRARWTVPARAIASLLTPTAEELAALTAAVAELDGRGMDVEARAARRLEGKVRALIPPEAGTRLAVDEEALLEALGHAARPGPRPAASRAVDAAVSEALKGRSLLRISYRRRAKDEPTDRVVAPYGLLLGVRRYLVARDVGRTAADRLRHYRVEDIHEAEVLDGFFEPEEGFSLRSHAERGFGSFESAAEHGEVVWRFRADAAERARRFVFHPTQTVEVTEDGALVVRFQASGFLEMCWHLYSWGDAVEVLAPDRLREMVAGHRRSDFGALP